MGYPEHDSWTDVSHRTGREHHWWLGKSPWHTSDTIISIRLFEPDDWIRSAPTAWRVEIYPHPDTGEMKRWQYMTDVEDDAERAAKEKVQDVMEEFALASTIRP